MVHPLAPTALPSSPYILNRAICGDNSQKIFRALPLFPGKMGFLFLMEPTQVAWVNPIFLFGGLGGRGGGLTQTFLCVAL